jgi:adenine-specific DNA-methyltransferase
VAALDSLIAQIEDEKLRARLNTEVERLSEEKTFGLVFEDHLPELTPIYNEKVRKGSTVALRGEDITDVWRVLSVVGKAARCFRRSTKEERHIPTDQLVVVLQFGEPIFPSLVPVDKVQNAPNDAPWHTLIEADNYHALQLLNYLYPGKVDCIYIDPPYNSGGQRDWKYNNNYVDEKDAWRHSKWLAMMKRRLRLARKLLTPDGVLMIAIDENEHSHLLGLLEDIFADAKLTSVAVVHNPRGNRETNFTMINDFTVHAIRNGVNTLAKSPIENVRPRKLRRWGYFSRREERRPSFYPVYVDGSEIVRIGNMPEDEFHPEGRNVQQADGIIEIWPIDDDGEERRWNYGRDTIEDHLDRIIVLPRDDGDLDLFLSAELSQPKSVWVGPELDAGGKYGTSLVEFITGEKFPYPKSLFTVVRALDNVVRNKPNAIVLDFFAGSGTTSHALNLINLRDGGHRRCVTVTNNEVSAEDAAAFLRRNIRPGDDEWERHGVCRSITWPRSKYCIQGSRDDGTLLEDAIPSGRFHDLFRRRLIKQLNFIDRESIKTLAKRKQLVGLLGKNRCPQSAVQKDVPFVFAEGYPATILFDEDGFEDWLEAVGEFDEIIEYYVVTRSKETFDRIRGDIHERLGPRVEVEEEVLPMSEGFPANMEYFRLEFLDKNHVALGKQFRELLPILWLRAGAMGPRPRLPKNMRIPPMLIPELNPFAVLIDEACFPQFAKEIESRSDITHVFLITDSEDAFHEMAENILAPHVIQLYRDYLENFMINKGDIG